MKYLKGVTLITAVSLLFSGQAFAAADGSSGTTSSGTADISVVVPKLVKITDIDDLSQTYDGSGGGFDQNDDVCIYSNMDTSSGKYTVKINGGNNGYTSGSAGFFVGNDTTAMEIPYTVKWNDVAGTTGETAVTHNTNLTDQTGFSNEIDCSDATNGATNANFHVQMTQANLLGLRPATYTGTITILITPQ